MRETVKMLSVIIGGATVIIAVTAAIIGKMVTPETALLWWALAGTALFLGGIQE